MLLEARYRQVLSALQAGTLNPQHFERMAVALANDAGLSVRQVTGGTDYGFDGALSQADSEPGPLVVTTRADVIGNLTANLMRVATERPHAARITAVVTSRSLSERRQNNLRERARELGFVLTDIFEEAAVAEFLYRHAEWSMTLLQIPGDLSPLSVFPLSRRPVYDAELLHRSAEVSWLESDGDALVVGPPGSGKTSLLRHLAIEGQGTFIVTADLGQIAAALRSACPRALFVDDFDEATNLCAGLARLRQELGLGFKIVATAWSEDPQLMQVLGLSEDRRLLLPQLSREQMVDVIRGAGLQRPDFLIQDVIQQAEGLPGLAVSLVQAILHGGVRDVLTGDAIAREFYSALDRLLGSRDETALVLAAISLGGRQGMRLGPVSEFTGLPQAQVRSLLNRLLRRLSGSGFVTPIRDDRIIVRPRRLRSVLIRDYLLQPPAYDVEPLLVSAPDRGAATQELILAAYAGARVDRLEEWVSVVPETEVLAEYAALGPVQSRWVLETFPDRATDIAHAALGHVPGQTIPALLDLAIADSRPTNSYPEHPMRLLADWVNEPPERHSAVERKEALLNSTRIWCERGGDPAVTMRSFAAVFATDFRGTRLSAGSGNQFLLTWGMFAADDIHELGRMWGELVPFLASLDSPVWPPLIDALHGIAFPSASTDPSSGMESRAASKELAAIMIRDIAHLAPGDPAVLHRLKSIADQLDIGLAITVDPDFELLFGSLRPRKDWRQEQREIDRDLERLAQDWSCQQPRSVALRLSGLLRLAQAAEQTSSDRTPFLCHRLAELVDAPSDWLQPVLDAELPSACVYPFLEAVVATGQEIPAPIMQAALAREALQPAAVTLYLKGRIESPAFAEAVWAFLPQYTGLVDLYAVRSEIPESVLRALLTGPAQSVRQAVAIGSWKGEEHNFPYPDLANEWEAAILDSVADEYWLSEILGSDSRLAFEWLMRHQNERESPLAFRGEFMAAVTKGLNEGQRAALLQALTPAWRTEYITNLVGPHPDVFRAVLEMEHLGSHRLDALTRGADDWWAEFIHIAAGEGWSESDMARATLGSSRSWSGPESKMWLAELARFEAFAADGRPAVRATTTICIQYLQENIDRALERERHEAVYGWGED